MCKCSLIRCALFAALAFPAGAAGSTPDAPPGTLENPVSLACPAATDAEVDLPFGPALEAVFVTAGPCTVSRECYVPDTCPSYLCPDDTVQCSSGPEGECSSGPGGSCGGWVQCDDDDPIYCEPQSCPGCGGAPSCNHNRDCRTYCSPYPGFCNSFGCCICA